MAYGIKIPELIAENCHKSLCLIWCYSVHEGAALSKCRRRDVLDVFVVYIEHISRRGHQAAVAEGVGGV